MFKFVFYMLVVLCAAGGCLWYVTLRAVEGKSVGIPALLFIVCIALLGVIARKMREKSES